MFGKLVDFRDVPRRQSIFELALFMLKGAMASNANGASTKERVVVVSSLPPRPTQKEKVTRPLVESVTLSHGEEI